MTNRKRIGLLTPSSNTVMEPMVAAMLAGQDDVTAHFSRFRVREISLSAIAMGQFDFTPQLAAADLLADAKADVIAWGGTSGGWVGIQNDRELCRRITDATGTPATTSTISLLAALNALEARDYALVTPYAPEVQKKVQDNFAGEGFRCVAERHLNETNNYAFSEFSEQTIETMIREVAVQRPQAIAIYCTNFNGTRIAARLEAELGIPILDSIAFTIWHAMQLAECDVASIVGWGQLFSVSAKGTTRSRSEGAAVPAMR